MCQVGRVGKPAGRGFLAVGGTTRMMPRLCSCRPRRLTRPAGFPARPTRNESASRFPQRGPSCGSDEFRKCAFRAPDRPSSEERPAKTSRVSWVGKPAGSVKRRGRLLDRRGIMPSVPPTARNPRAAGFTTHDTERETQRPHSQHRNNRRREMREAQAGMARFGKLGITMPASSSRHRTTCRLYPNSLSYQT